ncbi:hypothetical protein BT69DRAFT_1353028 [Atractiella rhizophila]|nr:hypothetical protein BT69DRAFT_1353028 [Atractiella rhizophila]
MRSTLSSDSEEESHPAQADGKLDAAWLNKVNSLLQLFLAKGGHVLNDSADTQAQSGDTSLSSDEASEDGNTTADTSTGDLSGKDVKIPEPISRSVSIQHFEFLPTPGLTNDESDDDHSWSLPQTPQDESIKTEDTQEWEHEAAEHVFVLPAAM